MRKILTALFAFAIAATAGAVATLVDFSSQPSDAVVTIDGERRGKTPMQLFDLKPGVPHHVRITKNGYEVFDDGLRFGEGEVVRFNAELQPVRGLLLVTSEPSGADISQNGYSLGVTPRVITTLSANEPHTLILRKTGYQDSKIAVRFDGRLPLVQNVKLVLDSGIINVTTEPASAQVTVNGISRGASPVTVSDVAKGRVLVEVAMPGYRTEKRELAIAPGDEQNLFVKLEPLPGSLRLSSIPSGARFYINDVPQSQTSPCVVSPLESGSYRVRAELDGYASEERTLFVAKGQVTAEEFKLDNIMGNLEIRTIPTGATVWIDGHKRGKTTGENPINGASDPFVIRNLPEGEHEVKIVRDGYAVWQKRVVARATETVTAVARLNKVFVPNCKIVLITGEVVKGVIVKSDAATVVVQVSLGMERPIPRDMIQSQELIINQ